VRRGGRGFRVTDGHTPSEGTGKVDREDLAPIGSGHDEFAASCRSGEGHVIVVVKAAELPEHFGCGSVVVGCDDPEIGEGEQCSPR